MGFRCLVAQKGRTSLIIHGEMNFGVLIVNEIKEKVDILLRVKKEECAIHIMTVNNTSESLYLLMVQLSAHHGADQRAAHRRPDLKYALKQEWLSAVAKVKSLYKSAAISLMPGFPLMMQSTARSIHLCEEMLVNRLSTSNETIKFPSIENSVHVAHKSGGVRSDVSEGM